MQDSQHRGDLALEMQQSAHAWFVGVDVVERADKKLVELRLGVLRLHGGFGELATVSGKKRAAVTFSEALTPVVNHHFPQRVQLALAG